MARTLGAGAREIDDQSGPAPGQRHALGVQTRRIDAVMLGVSAIQPIVTKRTEATVAALMRGARVDRWRRVALASVKQSRRAVLPEVRMPLTLAMLRMRKDPEKT